MTIINAAEERDALPVGSIVTDAFAATCIRARVSDPSMPSDWVRVTSAVKGGDHHHSPYLPADVERTGWSGWTSDQPVTAPTCQPSREAVVHSLFSAVPDDWDEDDIGILADVVLALPSGRSECEVKAEALREAKDQVAELVALSDPEAPFSVSIEFVLNLLAERALRGER